MTAAAADLTTTTKAKKAAIAAPASKAAAKPKLTVNPKSKSEPLSKASATKPPQKKDVDATPAQTKAKASSTKTKTKSAKPVKGVAPPVEEHDDEENDEEVDEDNMNPEAVTSAAIALNGNTNDFEEFGSDDEDDAAASESASEDDQTAALLAGFESSDDDEANDNEPPAATAGDTPALPTTANLESRLTIASTATTTPGVIYVGRVPHGFYEHQMTAYFSQFGDITRLRLSRNRRTGASRHFAFIEFASAEVAAIVAETMDNYLMFGHLLKVKLVPQESVHAELFKGAGRRFKAVPWNRIERARLGKVDREAWARKVDKERKRRGAKVQKLRALGYEYAPQELRDVADVPVQKAVEAVAPAEAEQVVDVEPVKQIGAPVEASKEEVEAPAVVEKAKAKKAKNQAAAPTADETKPATKAKAGAVAGKAAKGKKSKA